MIRASRLGVFTWLWVAASLSAAEPVRDCPAATSPLSSRSPLSDVLMHPGGNAALEGASPGLVAGIEKTFGGALPPGFANILTAEALLSFTGRPEADVAKIDAALAPLAIDNAFVVARCARYDDDRADLATTGERLAVLVFEKITGFRDEPSLAAARAALRAIAAERGWEVVFTDRGGVMTAANLARFRAVVWNNVSGDALTVPERAAFRAYIEAGGGFVGIHGSGGDPRWFWDWYADTLVGARFIGHPASPQFQSATMRLRDRRSGIATGIDGAWPLLEEWYSFDRNPADGGAVVVATIDEGDYRPVGYRGESLAMGEHPVAWRKFVGDGRAFYTAIGHRPENYSDANARRLLANGIAWAMGEAK